MSSLSDSDSLSVTYEEDSYSEDKKTEEPNANSIIGDVDQVPVTPLDAVTDATAISSFEEKTIGEEVFNLVVEHIEKHSFIITLVTSEEKRYYSVERFIRNPYSGKYLVLLSGYLIGGYPVMRTWFELMMPEDNYTAEDYVIKSEDNGDLFQDFKNIVADFLEGSHPNCIYLVCFIY